MVNGEISPMSRSLKDGKANIREMIILKETLSNLEVRQKEMENKAHLIIGFLPQSIIQ
jgi:hypothetical protein